jgi:hypothetical protein
MRQKLARVPLAGWVTLGLVALLVAGYFTFHALFVKVGRSVEQPFSGPARHNSFYVFERFLEARGIKVRAVRSWPQPLAADTAVLWFSSEVVPPALRSWLAQGGQLWSFRDPDPVANPYIWEATPWDDAAADETTLQVDDGQAESASDDQAERTDDGAANEESASSDHGAAPADAVSDPSQVSSGADDDASSDRDDAFDEEDYDDCVDGCLAAAQFRYGDGCLTLVRRYGIDNNGVTLGKTPARLDALLRCPKRPREVLIVTSLSSPWFGELLLEHAPGALLAFAALLLLTLWRAGKHFGPRHPAPSLERRQMLEHIGAVGTLAGRVGLAPLLNAARNQLRRQLLRHVPHGAGLRGDALVKAVADATEVAPKDVQRALLDEFGGSSQDALAIARAMQALWRKI